MTFCKGEHNVPTAAFVEEPPNARADYTKGKFELNYVRDEARRCADSQASGIREASILRTP